MAISGGAIVPLLMSRIVESGRSALAFAVPTACFVYLFLLSLRGSKAPAAAAPSDKAEAAKA
jgi:fucose permease